jgi:hypothetical protein
VAVALLAVVAQTPASGEGAPTEARCSDVAQPAPRHARELRPRLRLRRGSRARIVLETNCGTIAIRLATWRAPKTTSSVAALVRRGFYDGLTFHRVARGFVIQASPRSSRTHLARADLYPLRPAGRHHCSTASSAPVRDPLASVQRFSKVAVRCLAPRFRTRVRRLT